MECSSLCYTIGPCCLTYSIYNSLHLLIPNSQSTASCPPPHLATASLFSMSVHLFLFCGGWLCLLLQETLRLLPCFTVPPPPPFLPRAPTLSIPGAPTLPLDTSNSSFSSLNSFLLALSSLFSQQSSLKASY